jgi:hypothetical protein
LGLRRSGAGLCGGGGTRRERGRACVRRRGKQQREGRERARPVGRLWDLGGSSELNEKGKGEENSSHPEEPHRRRRRRRRRADSISFSFLLPIPIARVQSISFPKLGSLWAGRTVGREEVSPLTKSRKQRKTGLLLQTGGGCVGRFLYSTYGGAYTAPHTPRQVWAGFVRAYQGGELTGEEDGNRRGRW